MQNTPPVENTIHDRHLAEHTHTHKENGTLFRATPTDTDTINLTVKSLHETKSFGSDGIPLCFIEDSLFITAYYLTQIINTSIVTGIFPTQWKNAIVTPLYKAGDESNVGNYRPISLLPIFSKIIEKIVANQLTEHLENNKLLSDTQHGFRPHLSTSTALAVITDKLYNNMDNSRVFSIS